MVRRLLGVGFVILTGVAFFAAWYVPSIVRNNSNSGLATSRQFSFRLVDATEAVGIKSTHLPSNFSSEFANVMPYLQAVGASVAVVDPTGDGWYDIYLTTSQKGGRNSYFRNNRDGTFSEVAEQMGLANVNWPYPSWRSVFYDFDRDGKKDLFLFSYCPRLFRNVGSKGYVEVFDHGVPCGLPYGGVNALEVGKSGRISFVVSPYLDVDLFNPKNSKIFPNNFSGESNGAAVVFLENVGDFKFADPTKPKAKQRGFRHRGWGHAVGVYDFGARGAKDVWFPQDYSYERFYRNSGQDYFSEENELLAHDGFGRNGMGIDIADVDNDGRPVVFVTHIYKEGYKLSGNSFWKMVDPTRFKFEQQASMRGVVDCGWAWSGRFIDFENDGLLDLFVTNGFISASRTKNYWYSLSVLDASGAGILEDSRNWPPMREASLDGYQRSCLFHNSGRGVFEDIAPELDLDRELFDGRGFAPIDFLNTGSPSLIVSNQKAAAKFYRNEQLNQNAWIGFRFVGRKSNIGGWGVRVVVDLGDRKITRELEPMNGYASLGEDRLLIGLGVEPKIREIEVFWPSGIRQKIVSLPINHYHLLVEPEATAPP